MSGESAWFKPLEIDSRLLQRKTAKLLYAGPIGADSLAERLSYLAQNGFKLVYLRVRAEDELTNSAASACGGEQFGQQVEMPRDSSHQAVTKATIASGLAVYPISLTDLELRGDRKDGELFELYLLADRLLEHSHLAADPRLPREGAREIYREWTFNSAKGEAAQLVLVAKWQDKIVGFITISWKADAQDSSQKVGEISLLAVSKEVQGKHIGSALLDRALAVLAEDEGCSAIGLTTQVDNERAVSLYQSRGFVANAYYNYYHFHL